MSLKDRIERDNDAVFMNMGHFAQVHTWNGRPFKCVPDEETALKRKNNNVVDLSWDNNTREVILYVSKGEFPGKPIPNEMGIFDKRQMKILQVQENMGLLEICLVAFEPKVNGR